MLLLFNNKLSAQNEGSIFIDGKKVTEVNCYSWGDLEYQIPYNSEYEKFDELLLYCSISLNEKSDKNDFPTHVAPIYIQKGALKIKYFKNNKLIFKLFKKNEQTLAFPYYNENSADAITRGSLAYWNKTIGGGTKEIGYLKISFYGRTISSYTEKMDPSCNCLRKEPVYKETLLTESPSVIKLQNRLSISSPLKPACTKKVDLAIPCEIK